MKLAVLVIGADFAMMLTALTLVLPPTSYAWFVLAPHVAAAYIMMVFGPYLLVVSGCWMVWACLSAVHHAFRSVLFRERYKPEHLLFQYALLDGFRHGQP